jgi:hypothetical protein
MQPEISQFLSSMKKAIEQVVLVNLTDRFAQDQAGMIAGTLGFLQGVQDKAYHYELLENHLYRQLLADIVALLGEDPAASAIRTQLDAESAAPPAHLRPYPSLRGANETLREQLAALIHRRGELAQPKADALDTLLQPFFKDLQLRERAWVGALGFDSLPDPLPDLDALLYRDGQLHLPTRTTGA